MTGHPFPVSAPPYPPVTFAEGPNDDSVFLGNPLSYWRYAPSEGFDLTRDGPEEDAFTLETTTGKVKLSKNKTAVVIVDMQNFFLHPSIRDHPRGLAAVDPLVDHVIPACHEAGIQVVYVNWGLTNHDLEHLPISLIRGFSRDALPAPSIAGQPSATAKKPIYIGLGRPMKPVADPPGSDHMVEPGNMLMRGTWNAAVYKPLMDTFDDKGAKPDVIVNKNRISGMWGGYTELEHFLEAQGIVTCLWAGVNSDQCVAGSLNDAAAKGYDCLLLSDCCATASPTHAQETVEYNVARGTGFMLSGAQFAKGVRGA